MDSTTVVVSFLASLLLLVSHVTAFVKPTSPHVGKDHNTAERGVVTRASRCNVIRRSSETSTGGEYDSPRVLCHGEVLFDCIATPEAAGWDLGRVVQNSAWTPYPGGAPANVACALSKLKVSASFAGAVGCDKEGDELLQVLESNGVGTELAGRVEDLPTRTVMVTRDKLGDRTFAGFGGGRKSDSFADCLHSVSSVKDTVMTYLQPEGSWLVQGTLGLAYPSSYDSHVSLAQWAKEAGALRYLDVNWRPVFWNLAEDAQSSYEELARQRIMSFAETADVVKLTDDEAEWLFGISGEDALRDPSSVAKHFPSAEAVLVTAGAKGAAYSIGGHEGAVPVFESCKIVETTGAGDAFSAGFIAKCVQMVSNARSKRVGDGGRGVLLGGEWDPASAREAVRFGSAVGALTCGGDGAIAPQPSLEQVEKLLLGD